MAKYLSPIYKVNREILISYIDILKDEEETFMGFKLIKSQNDWHYICIYYSPKFGYWSSYVRDLSYKTYEDCEEALLKELKDRDYQFLSDEQFKKLKCIV